MRRQSRRAWFAGALLVPLLALAAGAAAAKPGGPPSLIGPAAKAKGAEPAPVAETTEQAIARLRRNIEELGASREAPQGIPAREVGAARDVRSELGFVYERELRAIEEVAAAREARARAERSERDWTEFDQPPPYSILLVDDLRDTADNARARIASLEAASGHLRDEQARFQLHAKRAQEATRLAAEVYEAATTETERAMAAWRREVAQLELRKSGAWIALSRAIERLQGEELAAQRAGLRLVERQIELARANTSFTDADLLKARQRYADIAADRRRELADVRAESERQQKQRDEASKNLAQLKASDPASAEEIPVADAWLRAIEARLAASRAQGEMLRGQITLAEEIPNLFEQRRVALTATDADTRRAALNRLVAGTNDLGRWKAFLQTRLDDARAGVRDAEARYIRAADLAPRTVEQERDAVASARRVMAAADGMMESLDRTMSRLNRWIADVQALESSRDLRTRGADAWSALREAVRNVWNFELFAVEDTLVVDGQSVTTSRGVTVGKSVGAVALYLVGFVVSLLLARRISSRAVAAGLDARTVRTVRRWVLTLIAILLLLLTLNVVRIPITVFAFLGGALAIGVGFGMQTMFKNFISGMILLMERSVQIGDIIEVEGTSGTVTAVDLRSSTMLGSDGTETIVPNSVLLENKVTNWTHSDRRVRRLVKVGVAYGSPAREVAELLEDCAKRHGLVLADPKPQVNFEDFGADALQFALYVWLELTPKVSATDVLSDLRFMIEKRLRDAGILMAYPQRDVHLDSSRPLRVEVVRGGEEAKKG
jgi:small-conductance mechanosensitive channel